MVDMNGIDNAHRDTWRATVRVGRNSVVAIVILLVLMAIFLL